MSDKSPSNPKSWRDVLPIHPAAEMFPMMSHDELKALGEDIRKNGLKTPANLLVERQSKKKWLLDGRNRLDAMERVGILIHNNPSCTIDGVVYEWAYDDEIGDPYAFVISANLHRRHLTTDHLRNQTVRSRRR
jgi:hypothetical protein